MNPPKMPIHIGDYKRDTGHLRAAEHGAYLLLLFHYWSTGSLPDDDNQLCAIACMTRAEWKRSRPTLEKFFQPGWKKGRVEDDLAAAKESYERRAQAGGKGGKAKAMGKQCSSNATAGLEQCSSNLLPFTIAKKEEAADAASPYAFESGVIRLNRKDFDQWTKAFVHLNLPAKLLALTEWAGQQRSWFNAVASALSKADAAAKIEIERAKPTPFKYNGMEGVI